MIYRFPCAILKIWFVSFPLALNILVFSVPSRFVLNATVFACSMQHAAFLLPTRGALLFICSLFKKEDAFMKMNYIPITVLPSVLDIYERLIQDQMLHFVQSILSLTPLWVSGRLWYTACTSTSSGTLQKRQWPMGVSQGLSWRTCRKPSIAWIMNC